MICRRTVKPRSAWPGLLATALLAALTLPMMALAQGAPLRLSEVIAGLEGSGYRILELEAKGQWIEVEVFDVDGRRKELILDPATASVVQEKIEH